MLNGIVVTAAVVAIIVVLVSLAVVDARMLPSAPVARSVLVSFASAGASVVPWLLAAPIVAPKLGELYLPIAALAALAGYLATIAVRAAGAGVVTTAVFGLLWSAVVFVPTAVLTFAAAGTTWPLGLQPIDHGGSLAVNVASGASALGVLLAGGARVGSATIRRTTGALAVLALCIGWIGWLVFIEMAIDEATPLILVNSLVGALGGIVGWLVVQRILHQSTTLPAVAAGLVSGLVAVTSGASLFTPLAAVAAGVVAGGAACFVTLRRVRATRRQQWFVVGSHLVAGFTGLVMIGLLATGMGYFYTGDTGITFTGIFSLLENEAISSVLVAVYSAAVSYGLWRLLRVISVRWGRVARPARVD